jgi:hypothetical protein
MTQHLSCAPRTIWRRLAAPLVGAGLFVTARLPMRLVNQLESGTSSIVFTFCARTFAGTRRVVTNSW